jgi:hypothetical protein
VRRYLVAYGLWLAGVLSAAAVAFLFYRRVLAIGAEELELELAGRADKNGSGAGATATPAAAPSEPEA